jgi:dTDP-4-dehydrorhamnose reductase
MILVFGASGQLGSAFVEALGDTALVPERVSADLTRPETVRNLILTTRPDAVINCAAYTAVDAAETDEATAAVINHEAVAVMAEATRDIGARFVSFSTDYVFDGEKLAPYVESDQTRPVNAYGRTKAAGERACLRIQPEALVIRTSWLISATHPNFVTRMLELGSGGTPASVVDDQLGQATVVDDLARSTLAAMERGVTGILHLSNPGPLTWYGLAREAFGFAGLDTALLTPCTTAEYPRPARRPLNSVLESERLTPSDPLRLPPLDGSLKRLLRKIGAASQPAPPGRPPVKDRR